MLLLTTILIQTKKRNLHDTLLLKLIKYENIYTPLHIHELRKEEILEALVN